MRRQHLKFFLILLIVSAGFAQQSKSFDTDKLLERLQELSSDAYEGRKTGTQGNAKARAYLVSEFEALGVDAFGSGYEHGFTFDTEQGEIKGVNVLAAIKGSSAKREYIVLSAHYDHLGIKDGKIYNGADDDASGIAALISIAEYLKENPPEHTVILAAFDAEEMGLRGARYFVDKMKGSNIMVNLNMDMISRSTKDELYVVGSRYTDGLKQLLKDFTNPTTSALLIGHDGTDDKDDWTYSSDHGPFHMAGIPFLYFGNEDHPAYHKPTDDFEDITPHFYQNSVEIILSILKEIDTKEWQ